MKKIKKILFVGVIGVMMTAGLVLVGCAVEEEESAGCPAVANGEVVCFSRSDVSGQSCFDDDCRVNKTAVGSVASCDC
jgi:hypothetical protein